MRASSRPKPILPLSHGCQGPVRMNVFFPRMVRKTLLSKKQLPSPSVLGTKWKQIWEEVKVEKTLPSFCHERIKRLKRWGGEGLRMTLNLGGP